MTSRRNLPSLARRLAGDGTGLWHLHGEVAEVRQLQLLPEQPAIGVRIGAHAPSPVGRQGLKLGNECAARVEQFFRLVAAHPVFEHLQVRRIFTTARDRYLMRAPKTFHLLAVDLFRAGPSFGAAQHDHRPARPFDACPSVAGVLLDRADAGERDIERIRHGLVHQCGIFALDEQRLVAEAAKEIADFRVSHPPQHGRIGDLVAVEMQDRQHGAVMRGVQELVGVPGRREWAGLGFAVADHAGDDQVRIVQRRAIGVHQRVAECSPPSWIEPGVSGAAWLGMPPGNENCLNSLRMPSASRAMSG